MAERYGLLPSEIIDRGSTVDLFVFDTAASYRAAKDREARGIKDPVEISTDTLLEKMEKYKRGKSQHKK